MYKRIIVTAFTLIISFSFYVVANSAGKTGRTNLSDTKGCTCHGSSPSTNVNVVIDGPDSLEIGANGTYQVTISGGPAVAAGTNIAVSEGVLVPVSGTLKSSNGELTHTSPVSFSSATEIVFEFQLTAPSSTGDITLAAIGNSVDLTGSTGNDEWNFAPDKMISVVAPNSIEDLIALRPKAFTLNQNYPNPFNPSTTISYSINQGSNGTEFVELNVYNAIGQKLETLVSAAQAAGNYSIQFDGFNLPSGTYFYTLRIADKLQTRKMILKK